MSGRLAVIGILEAGPRYLVRRALDCLADADVVVVDADWDRRGLPTVPGAVLRPVQNADEARRAIRAGLDAGLSVVRATPRARLPHVLAEEARPLSRAGYAVEAVPALLASTVQLARVLEDDGSLGAWPDELDGKAVIAVSAAELPDLLRHLAETYPPEEWVQWVDAESGAPEPPVLLSRVAEAALPATGDWWVLVGRDHVLDGRGGGLVGRRVLVLRAEHQASRLRLALEDAGAICLEAPMLEIAAPDWTAVDPLLQNLGRYQWAVFTSANGVAGFFDRLRYLRRDVRELSARLAAVGGETAARLRDLCLEPALVPDDGEQRQEGLLAAFQRQGSILGQSILVVTGERRSPKLAEGLRKAGAVVDEAVVYRTVPHPLPPWVDVELRRGGVDAVAFTSGSTARFLWDQLSTAARERLGRCRLVTIGPATRTVVEDLGLSVAAEADRPTIEALVEALAESFAVPLSGA